MSLVRTIRTSDPDARKQLAELRKPLLLDQLLQDSPELHAVRQIINDVRRRGDQAVAETTRRVDVVELDPKSFRVPVEQLAAARETLAPSLRTAIRRSIDQVREFQEHILSRTRDPLKRNGCTLQARLLPLRRVGVCVPGAAAPLPSSAIHCVVPAQVAGVKEIAIVAPPRHKGTVHPTIMAVAAELGVTEVYRVGGPQAVAALAIGTASIARADKVVGPGSIYTQLAKRLCYGMTDIEMFAGPSEVVVIADDSANPAHVAADLLAQAEHDPGAAILLTPSEKLLSDARRELLAQITSLSRQEGTARALGHYGALVLVRDLDEAVAMTNELAPEHVQIETRNADDLVDRVLNAGAIFVGGHGTEAAGDYVAGPSHVLPTGGSARFWSGLSCNDFLRRTSVIRYEASGLAADGEAIIALAEAEGLTAHANSVRVRLPREQPEVTLSGANLVAGDFSIQILRQGWITGLPDDQAKDDLCSHGAILLEIGGRRITTGEEDYGISESALALLRTLRSDHTPEARVAERLIFHGCGTVLMMSCPIGVDWSVRHLPDAVRLSDVVRCDTTNESQAVRFPAIDATVPVSTYVKEVVAFARAARSVFERAEKDASSETIPGEYAAFWQEYETLLRRFG